MPIWPLSTTAQTADTPMAARAAFPSFMRPRWKVRDLRRAVPSFLARKTETRDPAFLGTPSTELLRSVTRLGHILRGSNGRRKGRPRTLLPRYCFSMSSMPLRRSGGSDQPDVQVHIYLRPIQRQLVLR